MIERWFNTITSSSMINPFLFVIIIISIYMQHVARETLVGAQSLKGKSPKTFYIHIGPHKTGTTHLQSFFYDKPEAIENTCWPWIHSEIKFKQFHPLALSFQEKSQEENKWKSAFQSCFEKSQNIIISSETFSSIDITAITQLKEFLNEASHGQEYRVKIILTYREWLRLSFSLYAEYFVHPDFYENFSNFFDYLIFTKYDSRDSYVNMIKAWSSQFGRDNIIVLDYYGMEAATIDIIQVFCEIINGDCPTLHHHVRSANDNIHLDSLHLQFIFIFDNFLHAYHMKQCDLLTHAYQDHYVHSLKERKVQFPPAVILSSNLTLITPERTRLNDRMYDEYGDLMLYANKAANEEQIHVFTFEELNVNLIFQNYDEFMEEEKDRLLHEGKLCYLHSGERVVPSSK